MPGKYYLHTSVDGTAYTWDANGNMLSDGTSTYTYDTANHLTGVTGTDVSSFVYNGLGDRYQQMVNGATTTYQLDLAGSLVQVLADGEQTYVYGLETFKQGGRTVISQVSETQTGYYLPDVMGSVRQMTSSEGDLQLAQSYSPYGEELEEIGNETATFGYAGQLYDEQTGLLFLRARYYSPSTGRFISHDTWSGDAYMPMSYNMWLYGYGNPMRYTDPSGNFAILAAALPGLIGGTVGFLSGATIGGIVGACFYDMALTGQCGCAMKQEAFATSRSDWVLKNMMGGALVGGLLGAVAAYGPAGLLIASGIGLIGSAKDLIETVQIVNNETGWTTCTIARAILDVTGIVLSVAGGVTALRNWKATGGKWTWKPISKEEPTIKVDSHHNMKNDPDIPGQSHHLNQAAAYDTVIPHEEGVAIKLEGNILKDVDSPHYNAHKSLEGFWDQYRTSAGDFYGETPTNGKYNRALYDSLIEAGLSHVDAAYAVLEAYKQQLSYGLKNWHNVPRIPRKIYINWQ